MVSGHVVTVRDCCIQNLTLPVLHHGKREAARKRAKCNGKRRSIIDQVS